jgi:hypothetical protein
MRRQIPTSSQSRRPFTRIRELPHTPAIGGSRLRPSSEYRFGRKKLGGSSPAGKRAAQ